LEKGKLRKENFMLEEPTCSKRNCKYFLGVKWLGKNEITEVLICNAFPKGIPSKVAYGDNNHSKKIKGQTGDFIFERKRS